MCNLKKIREQLGMSQSALADSIGMTQGSITHYENARQDMPPRVAKKIIAAAAGMGVSITFDDIYRTEPQTKEAA